MATEMNTASRRALLAGLAALPALGVAGHALATTGIDRGAWDRAFAEWTHANEEYKSVYPMWSKAFHAVEAESPPFEAMQLKHSLFQFEHPRAVAHTLDIDKRYADFLAGEAKYWWADDPDAFKAEAAAAVESVKEWRRKHQMAKDRHDLDRLDAATDAALDRYSAAESALITMPAPDTAALHWKLERLFGEEADGGQDAGAYCNEWITALMADARRLLDRRA
jgi:hypothetical protein